MIKERKGQDITHINQEDRVDREINHARGKRYCPFCLRKTEQKVLKREPASENIAHTDLSHICVDIVRCLECSAVFVSRNISQEVIERYYVEKLGARISIDKDYFNWALQYTQPAIDQILRYIDKELRGALLDVGCGCGVLLFLAKQKRWLVTGLDLNAKMVKFVLGGLGIDCLNGTLFDFDLPKNHYSVITLIDVVEHLYEPVKTLARCRELLKPGGIILVKTPQWRMQYLKERAKRLLQVGTGNIAKIVHINQFDPSSMQLAFQQAGLVPVAIYPAKLSLQGMQGAPFSIKNLIEHIIRAAVNATVELLYTKTQLNLSFHLLGVARKPLNLL